MSDGPPEKDEFVSKDVFKEELFKMYESQARRRLKWTKKRINNVLELIADDEMPTVFMQLASPHHYYVNKYDVRHEKIKTIVVVKHDTSVEDKPTVVPEDNYYDILLQAHLSTDHGNFKKMVAYLEEINCFIHTSPLVTFLKLCKYCENKNLEKQAALKPPKLPPKPAVVNLIDLQATPGGGTFKWVLHYRDLNTKNSVLRPLVSNRLGEVACALLKIFLETGCPTILHSDGSNFMIELYKELINLWPICKNIELQHCNQTSMDKICEDIMKLIQEWLVENNSNNWGLGVYFVQYKVKCTFDETMLKSRHEALSENNPVTIKEESTSSVDNETDKKDDEKDDKSLNERNELEAEVTPKINDNSETNTKED